MNRIALSWRGRWGAAALAIAGTATYAASFLVQLREIAPIGYAVAVASGLAWIALGSVVLIVVNVAIQLAADATMTIQFIQIARRAGFTAAHAITLWALALHGSFIAILAALVHWRVFQ